MIRRFWRAFLRLAFHHFYNTFAFTYDWVSRVVSRGRWRAWTRAAIPYIVRPRVLDMPCGTGDLLLDLCAAGYAPIGLDLSPSMLAITRRKIQHARAAAPLLRASAQALPFAGGAFDSIAMTFPPEFVHDPRALTELHRVLRAGGRLIWVDSGRLLPLDWWSRLLDAALAPRADGSETPLVDLARTALAQTGFAVDFQTVRDRTSEVLVIIATKRSAG